MTQDRFTNPVTQHEIMEIMTFKLMRDGSEKISGKCCTVMNDETMDFSKRQLAVSRLQYVDDSMNIHTEFTRFCHPFPTCGEITSIIRMSCADLRTSDGMDSATTVLLKQQALHQPDNKRKR